MAITRAKKTPQESPKAENVEITPEQFIEGADAPAAQPSAALPSSREAQALAVVKTHLPWAAGAGILPLPGVDMAAIIAVQLRMLSKLAATYEVPFKEQAAKSTVASLMALLVQNSVAGGLASASKLVPVIGTAIGIAAMPAVAAAGTFAIGKVFITHFEAGGTFLDFDPKKVQSHFKTEFENARAGAANQSAA